MEICRAPWIARRVRHLAYGAAALLVVAGCGGGGGGGGGGDPTPSTTIEFLRADKQVVDNGGSVRVEWSVRNPGQQDGRTFCRLQASYEPHPPSHSGEVECTGHATFNLDYEQEWTGAKFTLETVDVRTSEWTTRSLVVPRPTRILHLTTDKDEAYGIDSLTLDWSVRNPGEVDGRTYCRMELSFVGVDDTWEEEVDCTGNAIFDISFPEGATAVHVTLYAVDNVTSAWTSTSVTVNRAEDPIQPLMYQFGTAGSDRVMALTTGADGSIVVAGDTTQDLFGENQGAYDVFVSKYAYDGTELWADQFGSADYDHPAAMAIDDLGNIYVVGRTLGDIDGNPLGGEDAFLRKYAGNGDVLWTRQFGTSETDIANDIAVLTDGSVVVVGVSDGPIAGGDFDGRYRAFVRVYSPSGSAVWTEEILSFETYAEAMTVTVDGNDNIYVGGKYNASDYENYRDAFVTRLSPTGAEYWLRRFEGPGYDEVTAVVLTDTGGVVVALDTSQIEPNESSRSGVVGLQSNGNLDWETPVFDSGIASGTRGATRLAVATDGTILYATNPFEAGSSLPILGALSPVGDQLWTEPLPVTTGNSIIHGLAASLEGSAMAAGTTDQTLSGTSNGEHDAFIWRHIP